MALNGQCKTSAAAFMNWIKRETTLPYIAQFVLGKDTFLGIGGYSIFQSDELSKVLHLQVVRSSKDIELTLDGILGLNYIIRASTNLHTWQNYASFSNI